MHFIPLEHAKQKLIFYVAQDLDQSIKSDVQQLVNELAASRVWSISPPSFVDEIDEGGGSSRWNVGDLFGFTAKYTFY